MFSRFAVAFALLFITSLTHAERSAPPVVNFNYQAKLTDSNGNLLNGTHTLYFTIDKGGTVNLPGTLLYAENGLVEIDNGVVNYSLGSNPATVGALYPQLFNFTEYFYLQVAVDVDTNIILPRSHIQSVPMALLANTASYSLYAQAAPWAGITGIPSDIANGIPVGNIVPVAKSGTQFSTIQSAIDSITDATSITQYLVLVAPGEYVEHVTMKPYVHLEGSGEKSTIISEVNGGPVSATLTCASNCDVRDLTVSSTPSSTFHQAVTFTNASQLRFRNVTMTATGQLYPCALRGDGGSVELLDCSTIVTDGGDIPQAVEIANCTVRMDRLRCNASGVGGIGLILTNCPSVVIRNSTIRAAGSGSGINYGMNNYDSTITAHNSEFIATGGGVVTSFTNSGTINFTNCEITGAGTTAIHTATAVTRFIACKISGGPMNIVAGATVSCTTCLDEGYVPNTFPTCP